MMFLGPLELPTLVVASMTFSDGVTYAAQAVIEGKPRMQFVAPNARVTSIVCALHVRFISPKRFIDNALALMGAREILTLQEESGVLYGDFVIDKVDWQPRAKFPDGTLMAASCTLALSDPGLDRPNDVRPRPMGVVGEAVDIVTKPKVENTSRPIDSVTPAEIARL